MQEAELKRAAVLAAAEAAGLDAVVATSPATVRWLLCGRGRPVDNASPHAAYTLVLTRDRSHAVFSNPETSRVESEERLDELGYEQVSFFRYEGSGPTVERLLAGARSTTDAALEAEIAPHRRRLGPDEVERYRAAARDAAAAMAAALDRISPEQSEHEAGAELARELRARGLFPGVLLVGGEQRMTVHRHPLPTEAPVGRHALLAATSERHGLYTSLTRIVSFGPPPPELARLAEQTAEVDATILAASRPGATLGEVFAVAERAYEEQGFPGEWRKHHQGGLTGYKGREVFGAPGEGTEIPDAGALAWNPSITGGGKSEDTVLATAEGVEVLTRTPELGELETSGLPRPGIVER